MDTSKIFFVILLFAPLCTRPGVLAQSGCIPNGTEKAIQAALSGPGSKAILCASAVFTINNSVTFTAVNQQIYTSGFPTGSTRAILRSVGSQATLLSSYFNGTVIKNIQVDGNRPALGLVVNGSANIEIGGAWNLVVDNVYSHDPRGWSCMHIYQGAPQCHNATVSNNQVGPSGNPNGTWADGISLDCINSLVTSNVITDATDGAIVIFGSPGSVITNNTIIAQKQVLLGGINMVDQPQYGGSYLNTRVYNNTINATGALIKTGIAMGTLVWGCPPPDGINFGAIVTNNLVTGAHVGFGFPVSGVANWTVLGNMDTSRHVGSSYPSCGGSTTSTPAGFQYGNAISSNLQSQYVKASLNYTLGISEPSILAIIQSPTACGVFTTNQGLIPGQTQKSCDGRFSLTLQSGGNLVETFGATQLWQSGTNGSSSAEVIMQADGNWVIYDYNGIGLWSTGTTGNNGAYLSVQNDGNMVIYTSNGSRALWSSGTCCH